jgi:hypothetical protein
MKFLKVNRGPSLEDESAAIRLIAVTSRSKSVVSPAPDEPAIEDRAEIPSVNTEWSIPS